MDEAWLTSPLGATVRRGIAFLLGLVAVAGAKYLHIELSPSTQAAIVALVMTYIAQSMVHSAVKNSTAADVAAGAAIKTVVDAVAELKKVPK